MDCRFLGAFFSVFCRFDGICLVGDSEESSRDEKVSAGDLPGVLSTAEVADELVGGEVLLEVDLRLGGDEKSGEGNFLRLVSILLFDRSV